MKAPQLLPMPSDLRWYTLYTKPRCEHVVNEYLQSQGFETYLPIVTINGGGGAVMSPFFPCYLFVRLDLSTGALSLVRWTPGLRRVVSFGERPAVVPDEAIALTRERLAAIEAAGGLPTHNFRPGDQVRIRSGPLADLEAVFEQMLKPAERANVLIHFLGRMNRVQVAVEDLEPVKADSAGPSSQDSTPQRSRRTRGRGRRIKH